MREFLITFDQLGHEGLYVLVQGDLYLMHKIRKAMTDADCRIKHCYELLETGERIEIHFNKRY